MENFRNAFEAVDEIFGELTPEQRVEYDFYNILGDFSVALVRYRMSRHLDQGQLGKLLGVSRNMISRYESGHCNLTIRRMNEICQTLGITLEIKFIQPANGGQRRSINGGA